EGAAVEARFAARGERAAREYRLVERLAVRGAHGQIRARGRSAGGEVFGHAAFVPGAVMPHAATVLARGVRLDALPGTVRGQGTATRGVRGELGGVVDLHLSMAGPPLGALKRMEVEPVLVHASVDWRDGS